MLAELNAAPILGSNVVEGAQSFGRWAAARAGESVDDYLARTGLVLNVVDRAPGDVSGVSAEAVNGATRTLPLGFISEQQFASAVAGLRSALVASGIDDAVVGVRGSSVTGFGSNPNSIRFGAPFGPASDIDFFVQSATLTNNFKRQPGFVHPDQLLKAYPELDTWSRTWSDLLGREITPAAWKPGALPPTPAILVTEP
jgi:large repetitive protein